MRGQTWLWASAEDDEVQPERVEPGQECPDERDDPEDDAIPVRVQRGGDDRVLREEARERRDADERERAREERPPRPWHELTDAAHLANVLLAGKRVDDDACGHEEQRLEERMRHQMEHPVRVRADARAEEHVADLRHRRVRDHAFDVDLYECDQSGDEQRERTHARRDELDRARLLEDRMRARDQVDARGDHGGGVDKGRDRRRAFHRVRQPGVQRDLRGLRGGAAEQTERDEVHRGRREVDVEGRRKRERPGVQDQHEEGERHRRVADRVHHERFLRGGHGSRTLVPEADQQIGAETDEPPAGEQ